MGRPRSTRICVVDGCDRSHLARGYCILHYTRMVRHGTTDAPNRQGPTAVDRFWSRVDKTEGCWLWTGRVSEYGYGHLSVNGQLVGVHRFSYELANGPVPTGLTVDHVCHNQSSCAGGNGCPHRRCVNPSHLEVVTQGENVHRGRGGAHWSAKTHCPQGHPYDDANTVATKSGGRRCRTCSRIWNQEYKHRKTSTDEPLVLSVTCDLCDRMFQTERNMKVHRTR